MVSIKRLESTTRIYLARAGYPYSIVWTPQQYTTNSFLCVVVKVPRLDKIEVDGAKEKWQLQGFTEAACIASTIEADSIER